MSVGLKKIKYLRSWKPRLEPGSTPSCQLPGAVLLSQPRPGPLLSRTPQKLWAGGAELAIQAPPPTSTGLRQLLIPAKTNRKNQFREIESHRGKGLQKQQRQAQGACPLSGAQTSLLQEPRCDGQMLKGRAVIPGMVGTQGQGGSRRLSRQRTRRGFDR